MSEIFFTRLELIVIQTGIVIDAEIAASRNGFSMKFNTLLWILTTGLQFVVTMWYRKQPVFYLPEGWLGPVTWWLALPFAPAGKY